MIAKKSQFNFTYDGPAISNGSIDVHVLIPALQSMAGLIQRADQTFNKDKAELTINIKAFREGSFETQFEFIQGWFSIAKSLFTGQSAFSPEDILAMIGLIGSDGIATHSLIELLKLIKKEDPKSVLFDLKGMVILNFSFGAVHVTNNVYNLLSDSATREHLDSLLAPLRAGLLDKIAVSDSARKEIGKITQSDANLIPVYLGENTEKESFERTAILQVIKPDLNGVGKWLCSEKGQRLWTSIEDKNFLSDLISRKYTFGSGDHIEAVLRVDRTVSPKRTTEEFAITRVVRVISCEKEIPFPIDLGTLKKPPEGQ